MKDLLLKFQINHLIKMNEIQDLLKCALCMDIFTGTPIILPCCNKTVCEHHMEKQENTANSKLFTCVLCETTHDMDKCKKFASNKTVEKLLKIQIDKFANLGDIYVRTINQVKSLEDNFRQVNDLIKDPKIIFMRKFLPLNETSI